MELTSQRFGRILERLREQGAAAGSDKRKMARMSVQAKVEVAVLEAGVLAQRFGAMTHDISPSGIGLLQSMPLEAGGQMLIELWEGRERALLAAMVRHCRAVVNGIFAIGLEFSGDASPELVKLWTDAAATEHKRIQDSILG